MSTEITYASGSVALQPFWCTAYDTISPRSANAVQMEPERLCKKGLVIQTDEFQVLSKKAEGVTDGET